MKKLLGILLFISIALSANAQLLWKVSGKGLEKPSYISVLITSLHSV